MPWSRLLKKPLGIPDQADPFAVFVLEEVFRDRDMAKGDRKVIRLRDQRPRDVGQRLGLGSEQVGAARHLECREPGPYPETDHGQDGRQRKQGHRDAVKYGVVSSPAVEPEVNAYVDDYAEHAAEEEPGPAMRPVARLVMTFVLAAGEVGSLIANALAGIIGGELPSECEIVRGGRSAFMKRRFYRKTGRPVHDLSKRFGCKNLVASGDHPDFPSGQLAVREFRPCEALELQAAKTLRTMALDQPVMVSPGHQAKGDGGGGEHDDGGFGQHGRGGERFEYLLQCQLQDSEDDGENPGDDAGLGQVTVFTLAAQGPFIGLAVRG